MKIFLLKYHNSERRYNNTIIYKFTVLILVDVEDGKDLSVVGDQSLSNHLSRHHQVLQDLQCGADDSGVPGVEGICRETVE